MPSPEEWLERLAGLADELKLDVMRPAIAACRNPLRVRGELHSVPEMTE